MLRSMLYKLLYISLILMSSVKLSHAQLGTAAGTDISTSFTIAYTVSSVSQSDTIAAQTFETSRKIDLLVTTTQGNGTEKTVTPSQTSSFVEYILTNQSNFEHSFTFSAAIVETNDVFVGSPTATIWYDGANNTCDGGTGDDVQITTYITLTSGTTERICVVTSDDVNNAASVTQNWEADFNLTVTATASDAIVTAAAGSTVITQTSGAYDKTVVQRVFSDDVGITGDTAYDGKHSATAQVKVYKSALTVSLTPIIMYTNNTNGEGFVCATKAAGTEEPNGRAIPGACLNLTYTLSNGAAGATATAIDWTIDIPAELTYVGELAAQTSANDAACTDSGNFNTSAASPDGTVVCNISSLAAGASVSVEFRATID